MVPEDIRGLIAWIQGLPLLGRGAESEIRRGVWMGIEAVFKLRIPHAYMHPRLDQSLREARTRREARLLSKASSIGANVPRLLSVFPSIGLIVMEYIDGVVLRDAITQGVYEEGHIEEAGYILGLLHRSGIAHGDPTTSNYIVKGGSVYLIDFGLSDQATGVEDLAVDIHLFTRAVESTHARLANELVEAFKRGYLKAAGAMGMKVVERAGKIRLRGRYVEERRTVWSI
ncbi:MAG: Kae1-associated kinase Bud32 [Desulfurococcales archaeon]|nr:Kae1-associated kinase Bud32 [Desulfurococcales archaeon]